MSTRTRFSTMGVARKALAVAGLTVVGLSIPHTALAGTAVAQSGFTLTPQTGTKYVGEEISLATTGGNGAGAVTYALDAKAASTCSITSGKVTNSAKGTCKVVATKAASAAADNTADGADKGKDFLVATSSATFTFSAAVKQAAVVIPPVAKGTTYDTGDTGVTIAPTGGSGTKAITLSMASGDTDCTIDGLKVTRAATKGGTCTITATNPASTGFLEAVSKPVVFTFLDAQSDITVTKTGTATTGKTGVTIAYTGGSGDGKVTLTVVGTGCKISKTTLTATTAGDCTVTATKAADLKKFFKVKTGELKVTFS